MKKIYWILLLVYVVACNSIQHSKKFTFDDDIYFESTECIDNDKEKGYAILQIDTISGFVNLHIPHDYFDFDTTMDIPKFLYATINKKKCECFYTIGFYFIADSVNSDTIEVSTWSVFLRNVNAKELINKNDIEIELSQKETPSLYHFKFLLKD